MGDFEFDTSKVGKVNNARGGGYMITGENDESKNEYERAKEDKLRQEKELVHREIHPLFHKTEEEVREYDNKVSKEAEEQKRKSRELAGWCTPITEEKREMREAVMIVRWPLCLDWQKKGDSKYSEEKIRENKIRWME